VVLLFAVIVYLAYQLTTKPNETSTLEYDTNLIQQQIKNVGKLVVTEGHFAEVITYKDQKKYLLDVLSFEKKALVVVNAEVTVSFDLSKITYDIDAPNKTLTIKFIPKEEIKIYPDYKYYDMEQSKLNEFTAEDYNKINKIVRTNLAKKIEKSSLKTNAKNRLVSELYNILILTKSLGWKLQYNGNEVNSESEINLNVKG
jgi:lipopolysaccharide export LptBFGC system permease protein LptF